MLEIVRAIIAPGYLLSFFFKTKLNSKRYDTIIKRHAFFTQKVNIRRLRDVRHRRGPLLSCFRFHGHVLFVVLSLESNKRPIRP
jgi:hypothetical protein